LRGALLLIAVGLLLGVPLALAAARFLDQHDPMILATAILTLGLSGLVAALIPAFRATSTAPVEALRAE
jgi:ABC-type antimicrobial peptide transport system permease subunit